jgi:hypothetical protein
MCSSVPVWRKSSHSGSNGNCVEIAWHQGAEGIGILVRDSKFPGREPLVFTLGEWAVFLERVKTGDFDVLASPATPDERTIAEISPAMPPRGRARVIPQTGAAGR